ncbi:hypothetical protein Xcc3_02300 [Xanthomonas campestris pv. campestris]|nr:hypothetical protein Xcc3_02300 [Xanthomonas campestris pv. campestris]
MHFGAIGQQQAVDIGLGVEQKARQGAAGFGQEIGIDPMHGGTPIRVAGEDRQRAPRATRKAWLVTGRKGVKWDVGRGTRQRRVARRGT